MGISCPKAGLWANTKVKALEKVATSERVAASGLVWVKVKSLKEGSLDFDSSVKKFYTHEDLAAWAEACHAKEGDLICVFAGPRLKTQTCMGKFRHIMGTDLGLRKEGFAALWVVDFPLLEYDEEEGRYQAMHHPFTSCKPEVRPSREEPPAVDGASPVIG